MDINVLIVSDTTEMSLTTKRDELNIICCDARHDSVDAPSDDRLPVLESLPLKYRWCFWYHMLENDSWDVKSYRMVYSFATVRDFWRMQNNLPPVFAGMYFVMKDGIMPVYEDAQNLNGALYSFRIMKKKLQEVWNELLMSLIGNTLYPDPEAVNGVSINPKSCVIKVWLSHCPKEPLRCDITKSIPNLIPEKALYLLPRDGIKPRTSSH